MNIHKNARTTPRSRAMLVHRVLREHWPVSAAAELVDMKVDLIVTRGSLATQAAKNATRTIPVVMAAVGEPLLFVASFAHPGGNLTGLSSVSVDLETKRLGLLRELLPGSKRIAVLYNLDNPANRSEWRSSRRRRHPWV
jgi:putative ABC transport system substrate-binding protein